MAEYLDNDEDGVPDNPLITDVLEERNATLSVLDRILELDPQELPSRLWRASLRLDEGRPDRESRELGLCATDDARSHVLESLEARSLGDLEWAEEAMARAVEIEPQNRELGLILSSIRKLLDIVRRGH